ncbi:MAG: hypothetical protein HFE83_06920 [Lachnospiraceae bacterium]|nr:hypothetical protein [Lachnospiraceae bacterium]
MLDRFIGTSREAIARGASAIVPFANGTQTLAYKAGLIKEGIDRVPVLDAVSIAVKAAETLAVLNALRVHASRKLCIYGHPDEETFARILRIHEDSFRILHEGLKK